MILALASLLAIAPPFFIKGVVGTERLDQLAAAGANAIRIVDARNAAETLDRAHANGLRALVTLDVGQARLGFDWSSADQRRGQRERLLEQWKRYVAHPAPFMWSLGSEVEVGYDADENLWKGLGELAEALKAKDAARPVILTLAEVTQAKVDAIVRFCPKVDAIGVNTYAGLASLPQRLETYGWKKPWLVTEFGPFGPWEVAKTPWGAAREPMGQQKEDIYLSNYLRSVEAHRPNCWGSFAFFWGHRYEGTPTWFGLFLPTGERLGGVDALTFAWSRKWPANRCPRIFYLDTTIDQSPVAPGSEQSAVVVAFDPDDDPLTIKWEVRAEMTGDGVEPKLIYDAISGKIGNQVQIRAPLAEGAYRLVVVVTDGKGNAATANVPFLVKNG